MNIYSYNYKTAIAKMPELEERMNPFFLSTTPEAKYTTGVKGIANVYIPDGDGFLIINEKNALYALIFAESIRRAETDPRFKDESRNFDRMIWSLMPQDDEVGNIQDPFYRGLFKRSGIKDDIRNALNSKAFEHLFNYEVVSRYVCINLAKGSQYDEAEIFGVAAEIYQDELQSEMDKTGSRGLSTLSRALVRERAADRLAADYGWEFDHREYGEVSINEALLNKVCLAYPHIQQVVLKTIEVADEQKDTAPSAGLIRLSSVDLNPIGQSFIYQRGLQMGLDQVQQLVDFTEEDYQHWNSKYKGEATRDEQRRDEYMRICVRDFVMKTNDKRGKEYDSMRFNAVVDQITLFVRNKQIRLQV